MDKGAHIGQGKMLRLKDKWRFLSGQVKIENYSKIRWDGIALSGSSIITSQLPPSQVNTDRQNRKT